MLQQFLNILIVLVKHSAEFTVRMSHQECSVFLVSLTQLPDFVAYHSWISGSFVLMVVLERKVTGAWACQGINA